MLDGGGSGGGVATPWYDYDLQQMWQIVNGQNTDTLWQQASGWKKTTELTSLHLYNLKEYKEQLAEAWPPGRSEASQAYMAELDKLIASVQETHDAASANYQAVVSLALAVGDAKRKLEPLHEEYQSNAQKLTDYNQQVEAYNADTTAMPQPAPVSPVREGRQNELNNRARSIMYGISGEIRAATTTLKPPAPYQPPTPGRDSSSSGGDPNGGGGVPGGGGGMLVPPVIPPVRPAPSPPPASFSPQPAPPPPPPPSSPPPGLGQGPILGGGPPPAPPLPTPAPPIIQPSPVPAPPPVPGPLPPIVGRTPPSYGPSPGTPPKATLPTTGPVTGLGITPHPKAPAAGPANLGPRAMPPGGVIGGQPGAGLARPGAGQPVPRINPPGGMIGGAGLGAGTGARPGQSFGMPASRAAKRRDQDEPVQHWDPDNPWETEEGVAPVVLPPREPRRHDPGPAIGQGR